MCDLHKGYIRPATADRNEIKNIIEQPNGKSNTVILCSMATQISEAILLVRPDYSLCAL